MHEYFILQVLLFCVSDRCLRFTLIKFLAIFATFNHRFSSCQAEESWDSTVMNLAFVKSIFHPSISHLLLFISYAESLWYNLRFIDGFMFESLIKGHCKICNMEAALTLFHEMERRWIAANLFCYTDLINGLCSKGRMEEASKLVEELLERDLLLGINTDSRLYSEYFRRLNSVGTDNLYVGLELDILFVHFIKRIYHEGKI